VHGRVINYLECPLSCWMLSALYPINVSFKLSFGARDTRNGEDSRDTRNGDAHLTSLGDARLTSK